MRTSACLSLGLVLAGSIACSSEPLSAKDDGPGFAALVVTQQTAGVSTARLRVFGLELEGAAEELCPDITGGDFSPDRRHVACESGFPSVVNVYSRGHGLTQLGEFQSPVFSPAGDRLALSAPSTLFVARADGSELSALASDPELGEVLGAALWSSSGRYVAVLAEHGGLVWDVDARSLTQSLSGYESLEWLPGRERLAATRAGTLLFVDGDGQNAVQRADSELTGLWPGFSASGEWLAYPRAADLLLLNHVTGEQRSIAADIRDSWLDWSPTDDVLVVDHAGAVGPELLFWSPSGEFSVPRPEDAYGTVQWSPDGSLLRDYANESSLIYDGASGEVVARLDGRLQWSPSGQNLTTITSDDSVWLADRVGGAPRVLTDYGTGVSWFPDSQHFALQSENELSVSDVQGSPLRVVARLTN